MGHFVKKHSDIVDELIDIIADLESREKESITPDMKIFSDIGFDSLDFMEMSMLVEERYEIVIKEPEVTRFNGHPTDPTVADLAVYVAKKISEK